MPTFSVRLTILKAPDGQWPTIDVDVPTEVLNSQDLQRLKQCIVEQALRDKVPLGTNDSAAHAQHDVWRGQASLAARDLPGLLQGGTLVFGKHLDLNGLAIRLTCEPATGIWKNKAIEQCSLHQEDKPVQNGLLEVIDNSERSMRQLRDMGVQLPDHAAIHLYFLQLKSQYVIIIADAGRGLACEQELERFLKQAAPTTGPTNPEAAAEAAQRAPYAADGNTSVFGSGAKDCTFATAGCLTVITRGRNAPSRGILEVTADTDEMEQRETTGSQWHFRAFLRYEGSDPLESSSLRGQDWEKEGDAGDWLRALLSLHTRHPSFNILMLSKVKPLAKEQIGNDLEKLVRHIRKSYWYILSNGQYFSPPCNFPYMHGQVKIFIHGYGFDNDPKPQGRGQYPDLPQSVVQHLPTMDPNQEALHKRMCHFCLSDPPYEGWPAEPDDTLVREAALAKEDANSRLCRIVRNNSTFSPPVEIPAHPGLIVSDGLHFGFRHKKLTARISPPGAPIHPIIQATLHYLPKDGDTELFQEVYHSDMTRSEALPRTRIYQQGRLVPYTSLFTGLPVQEAARKLLTTSAKNKAGPLANKTEVGKQVSKRVHTSLFMPAVDGLNSTKMRFVTDLAGDLDKEDQYLEFFIMTQQDQTRVFTPVSKDVLVSILADWMYQCHTSFDRQYYIPTEPAQHIKKYCTKDHVVVKSVFDSKDSKREVVGVGSANARLVKVQTPSSQTLALHPDSRGTSTLYGKVLGIRIPAHRLDTPNSLAAVADVLVQLEPPGEVFPPDDAYIFPLKTVTNVVKEVWQAGVDRQRKQRPDRLQITKVSPGAWEPGKGTVTITATSGSGVDVHLSVLDAGDQELYQWLVAGAQTKKRERHTLLVVKQKVAHKGKPVEERDTSVDIGTKTFKFRVPLDLTQSGEYQAEYALQHDFLPKLSQPLAITITAGDLHQVLASASQSSLQLASRTLTKSFTVTLKGQDKFGNAAPLSQDALEPHVTVALAPETQLPVTAQVSQYKVNAQGVATATISLSLGNETAPPEDKFFLAKPTARLTIEFPTTSLSSQIELTLEPGPVASFTVGQLGPEYSVDTKLPGFTVQARDALDFHRSLPEDMSVKAQLSWQSDKKPNNHMLAASRTQAQQGSVSFPVLQLSDVFPTLTEETEVQVLVTTEGPGNRRKQELSVHTFKVQPSNKPYKACLFLEPGLGRLSPSTAVVPGRVRGQAGQSSYALEGVRGERPVTGLRVEFQTRAGQQVPAVVDDAVYDLSGQGRKLVVTEAGIIKEGLIAPKLEEGTRRYELSFRLENEWFPVTLQITPCPGPPAEWIWRPAATTHSILDTTSLPVGAPIRGLLTFSVLDDETVVTDWPAGQKQAPDVTVVPAAGSAAGPGEPVVKLVDGQQTGVTLKWSESLCVAGPAGAQAELKLHGGGLKESVTRVQVQPGACVAFRSEAPLPAEVPSRLCLKDLTIVPVDAVGNVAALPQFKATALDIFSPTNACKAATVRMERRLGTGLRTSAPVQLTFNNVGTHHLAGVLRVTGGDAHQYDVQLPPVRVVPSPLILTALSLTLTSLYAEGFCAVTIPPPGASQLPQQVSPATFLPQGPVATLTPSCVTGVMTDATALLPHLSAKMLGPQQEEAQLRVEAHGHVVHLLLDASQSSKLTPGRAGTYMVVVKYDNPQVFLSLEASEVFLVRPGPVDKLMLLDQLPVLSVCNTRSRPEQCVLLKNVRLQHADALGNPVSWDDPDQEPEIHVAIKHGAIQNPPQLKDAEARWEGSVYMLTTVSVVPGSGEGCSAGDGQAGPHLELEIVSTAAKDKPIYLPFNFRDMQGQANKAAHLRGRITDLEAQRKVKDQALRQLQAQHRHQEKNAKSLDDKIKSVLQQVRDTARVAYRALHPPNQPAPPLESLDRDALAGHVQGLLAQMQPPAPVPPKLDAIALQLRSAVDAFKANPQHPGQEVLGLGIELICLQDHLVNALASGLTGTSAARNVYTRTDNACKQLIAFLRRHHAPLLNHNVYVTSLQQLWASQNYAQMQPPMQLPNGYPVYLAAQATLSVELPRDEHLKLLNTVLGSTLVHSGDQAAAMDYRKQLISRKQHCPAIVCSTGDYLNGNGSAALKPYSTDHQQLRVAFGSGLRPLPPQAGSLQQALAELDECPLDTAVGEAQYSASLLQQQINAIQAEIQAIANEVQQVQAELATLPPELPSTTPAAPSVSTRKRTATSSHAAEDPGAPRKYRR